MVNRIEEKQLQEKRNQIRNELLTLASKEILNRLEINTEGTKISRKDIAEAASPTLEKINFDNLFKALTFDDRDDFIDELNTYLNQGVEELRNKRESIEQAIELPKIPKDNKKSKEYPLFRDLG